MDPTINVKIGLVGFEASASGWLGVIAVTLLVALVVLMWRKGRHRVPLDKATEPPPRRGPQRLPKRPHPPEALPSPPKEKARQ